MNPGEKMPAQLDNTTRRPLAMTHNDSHLTLIPESRPSKKWGNPSPIALGGLFICLAPLTAQMMHWRGSELGGRSNNGPHFFCGGVLMLLAGIFDFFLGDSFSSTIHCVYGGFWLALGGAFAPGITPVETVNSGDYLWYTEFAFFYVFMGIFSLVMFISSLRSNAVLATLFLGLIVGFEFCAAEYFNRGIGNPHYADKMEVGAGAAFFVSAIATLYLFQKDMFEITDFPIHLPVGDLSGWITPASQRKGDVSPI